MKCHWQVPLGDKDHRCRALTLLLVDRERDGGLPLCGYHLTEYLSLYGPHVVLVVEP